MSSFLQQSLPPPPPNPGRQQHNPLLLRAGSLLSPHWPLRDLRQSSLSPTPSPGTPSSARSSLTHVWKTEVDSPHASLLAKAGRPRLRPFALGIVNLTLHVGLPYQTVESKTYPWPPSVPSSDTSLARDGCSRDACMTEAEGSQRIHIPAVATGR